MSKQMSKLVRGNSALIRLWKEIAEMRSQMDKRISDLEKREQKDFKTLCECVWDKYGKTIAEMQDEIKDMKAKLSLLGRPEQSVATGTDSDGTAIRVTGTSGTPPGIEYVYKTDHISETTDDKRSQDAEDKLMDASIKGQQDFELGKRWTWERMHWQCKEIPPAECLGKFCLFSQCPKMKE